MADVRTNPGGGLSHCIQVFREVPKKIDVVFLPYRHICPAGLQAKSNWLSFQHLLLFMKKHNETLCENIFAIPSPIPAIGGMEAFPN